MASKNFRRSFSKLAVGMLGGYFSGGRTGSVIGGATAVFTGGKNKPLKSFLIGAGSGFIGRTVSNKMGYTTPTPTYASRSVGWLSNLFSAPQGAPVAEGVTPPFLNLPRNGGVEQGGYGYPGEVVQGGINQEQGGSIVPLLLLGGAIILLGVA